MNCFSHLINYVSPMRAPYNTLPTRLLHATAIPQLTTFQSRTSPVTSQSVPLQRPLNAQRYMISPHICVKLILYILHTLYFYIYNAEMFQLHISLILLK